MYPMCTLRTAPGQRFHRHHFICPLIVKEQHASMSRVGKLRYARRFPLDKVKERVVFTVLIEITSRNICRNAYPGVRICYDRF